MKVKRIMSILVDGNEVVGHVKLSYIGDKVSMNVDVINNDIAGLTAVIDTLNGDILTIKLDRGNSYYSIDGNLSALESLNVVIVDDDNNIRCYSNNMGMHTRETILNKYVNAQNESTYSEVIENIAVEIDDINDAKCDDIAVEDAGVDTRKCDSIETESEENNEVDETKAPFYDSIRVQLDDLFSRYEREKTLEERVIGSRFAKIYYSDDAYYVVGEICDDAGKVEVICYGYPGEGGTTPPSDIKGNYEWLPISRDNPHGAGYYLMYQNAKNGELISC